MDVREAGEGDAVAITSLCAQLGYPLDLETVRRYLAARPGGRALLVVDGPRGVVGIAEVQLRELLVEPRCAELTALVVDEAQRGRGVGATLLAAAEEWARTQGVRKLRVRSNVIRERAHAFYRRSGYQVTKTQLAFLREI